MSTKLTAQQRKERPIYSGFIKYFPLAIREVSNISFVSNEQHNPGTEMHWDRTKSKDELDALMRHLADYSRGIEYDDDGQPHLGKVAWRAMAMFEKWLEEKEGAYLLELLKSYENQ